VLIKLEAAGINGSDLMMIDGQYGIRPKLPSGIGAEGVGRVEKAGKGASHLEGKRVVILPTYEQATWAAEYTVATNIMSLKSVTRLMSSSSRSLLASKR
jgi:NADPH:quinone reductase-like Zn-dependent oxidoreductase